MGPLLRQWAEDPSVAEFTPSLSEVLIVGLHADGVQYTSSMRAGGAKAVFVASVNIISGQDLASRGKRHFLSALSKRRLCDCGCRGFHTLQAVGGVFRLEHAVFGPRSDARLPSRWQPLVRRRRPRPIAGRNPFAQSGSAPGARRLGVAYTGVQIQVCEL